MMSDLSNNTSRVTRLAPSPTGALHLGNARTFLTNWALAKQQGWKVVFRIDDLDAPRIKDDADIEAIDDLGWMGLTWDGDPLYQTQDLAPYHAAIEHLRSQALVYPCTCTRKEIESAQSAPHGDEHELRYPGTCRTSSGSADRETPTPGSKAFALRVKVPDESITFADEYCGNQSMNVQHQVGDFVIQSKAELPSYQLAVVVDDARQGVTDVVRGDDLIRSTGRQLWLYRYMADLLQTQQPRYWHLPLVVAEDGRRLAKRHADTRLAFYREQNVPTERIIGLMATWSGIQSERRPMSADDFVESFDIKCLPKRSAVFTEEDHAWLLSKTN